ncbi:glutamine--fructose-6-phosphate transaminase (isomerizing) [Candidatus Daviesbacteria bacterium]|nr:glutamine--fructose-6-phosphate transaminase (isomerizing) [Candidatus Daviesbacteria bacterium]
MCGIFGVIGQDTNAVQTTFNGLKDIEYRGYDSWGIASWNIEDGIWKIEKNTGFLPKIMDSRFRGNDGVGLAIGHTRWATHGGVTQINAHPHKDCSGKLVLVHNGIVENYLELKKTLKSHNLKSETDTEVIVHLIEEALKKNGLNQAVLNIFQKLRGLNAIVVSDGNEIIAAKVGSPLIAGVGNGKLFIASDPNALLPHTKKLVFLQDNQLIRLNKELELYNSLNSRKLQPIITTVPWEHSTSGLQKYKYFLEKEIYEQPKALRNIAQNAKEVEQVAGMIRKAYGTFFIACGSASYSCLLGVYLFSKIAKKHVNFSVGSEFNYIEDYIKPKSLVVAVSQSGESIDTLEPVLSAKKHGAKTVALVNVLGSTLYRSVDFPVLLRAGVEKAVCSTKALTAMFAHMVFLSYCLVGKRKTAQKIILESAREIESILKRRSAIKNLAGKIFHQKNIFILGRGLSYPVAMESSLKIKENAYIHAEGFAGGELKHGVIALIEKNTPVIVFVPEDETKQAILANAMEVKARGAFIIGVGPENNPVFDFFFKVRDVGASSVIPHPVFAQLLSYYLALKLGLNPDRPRNLAKSVVVR